MPKRPPVNVLATDPLSHDCEALLLPVSSDQKFSATLRTIDKRLQGSLLAQFGPHFSATASAVMVLPTFGQLAALHVVIVGLGPSADVDATTLQAALVAGIRKAYDWGADHMAIDLAAPPPGYSLATIATTVGAASHAAQEHLQQMDVLLPDPQAVATVQAALHPER